MLPVSPAPASRPRRPALLLAAALLALPGTALAQGGRPPAAPAPAAPAAPRAEEPERTSAQFGDWTVSCVSAPGVPGGRACEMLQVVQDNQRQLGAALAVGRLGSTAPWRLVVRVPVNILTAQPAKVMLDNDSLATTPFRTCVPAGCFAEVDATEDGILRRLRARAPDQPGRIEWQDSTGAQIVLPFSARGFGAALDALARQ